MFQTLICQVTKDSPLRRFATPPPNFGEEREVFQPKLQTMC